MSAGYKKHILWIFEAKGEFFALSDIEPDCCMIEEIRKNGQEDCHFRGVLELQKNKRWKLIEGAETLEEYFGKPYIRAIEKHINEWGMPV